MFKIRSEHIQAFDRAAAGDFENRAFLFLKEFFPRHFNLIGEEGLRKVVATGWPRAKKYGFLGERAGRLYLSMMFMLGSGFDSDPRFPWAMELLQDQKSDNETERIDRLYARANAHLDQAALDFQEVLGTIEKTRFAEELDQLRHERDEEWTPTTLAEFSSSLLRRARRAFPKTCEAIGGDALQNTIRRGIESARRYGLTTRRSAGIYCALAFILGSGFDADPLVPWAEKALNDPANRDPKKRSDALLAEALKCLKGWL